jgi:hypothetical protein
MQTGTLLANRYRIEAKLLANQQGPLIGTYVLRTLARALAMRNGPGDNESARR